MERSVKVATSGKVPLGLTKSLGAFYDKIKISSQNALPRELFTYGIPYEASRTYRTMKCEFECRRSQAMIEVHRQASRGF